MYKLINCLYYVDNLKNQIIFRNKYKIDDNQLILLEILLIAQNEENNELVKMYFTSTKDIRLNLIHLQNAGIILKTYKIPEKGEKLDIYAIPFNKNFVKDFYKSSFEMGKELFEAYPQFGIINNVPVGIRSVSKRFNSLEDFYRFYGKTIRNKPEMHQYIIDLINWAKEQNVIVCSLCNFVIDHKWEELQALKDGNIANVNFDAVKIV